MSKIDPVRVRLPGGLEDVFEDAGPGRVGSHRYDVRGDGYLIVQRYGEGSDDRMSELVRLAIYAPGGWHSVTGGRLRREDGEDVPKRTRQRMPNLD